MTTTINDILQEIRLKSMTEREKGADFERLMKLWFLTDPRYADLEKVWLWEEFPARKDFGGKDLGSTSWLARNMATTGPSNVNAMLRMLR